MADKQRTELARAPQDSFALLRQMTSELDRVFGDWPRPEAWRTVVTKVKVEDGGTPTKSAARGGRS